MVSEVSEVLDSLKVTQVLGAGRFSDDGLVCVHTAEASTLMI